MIYGQIWVVVFLKHPLCQKRFSGMGCACNQDDHTLAFNSRLILFGSGLFPFSYAYLSLNLESSKSLVTPTKSSNLLYLISADFSTITLPLRPLNADAQTNVCDCGLKSRSQSLRCNCIPECAKAHLLKRWPFQQRHSPPGEAIIKKRHSAGAECRYFEQNSIPL